MEDIDFLCGTSNSSYPLADKTRNVNQHYHDISRIIWECANAWQYDDSNKTTLPHATTALVHGQQDYGLPSTAQRLHRVEVKDSNGDFQKLEEFDEHDVRGMAMTEWKETNGLPTHYDLKGLSVYLYPPPSSADVTLAAGLKIYVDRDVTEFTTASTTAAPGFATPFHRILSYSAAVDYEKDPTKLQLFMTEKARLIEGLKRFYSTRHIERPNVINPRNKRSWRQYL